jgi:hypothetical protein
LSIGLLVAEKLTIVVFTLPSRLARGKGSTSLKFGSLRSESLLACGRNRSFCVIHETEPVPMTRVCIGSVTAPVTVPVCAALVGASEARPVAVPLEKVETAFSGLSTAVDVMALLNFE